MRALLVAVTAFFMCSGVLPAADTLEVARPAGCLGGALDRAWVRTPTQGGFRSPWESLQPFQAMPLNTFALPEEEPDRKETSFRRSEILFFSSLPVTTLISLLGVIAFRSAAGHTGDFSSIEYQYLALSTIGMSLYIAASDSRSNRSDKTYRRGHR
jgi:hypothetical protein